MLGLALLALTGCGSTKAAKGTGGSGEAPSGIAQGQCGPGDTTESCCLKTDPGQYERCGVIPPKEPAPGVPAPLVPDTSPLEESELMAAERRRKNSEICQPYYERCIEKGGEYKKGRVYNETRCMQCFDYCRAYGFWPLRIDKKVCP
jgi:hypothetical protein